MWYAVETAFINGKFYGSRICEDVCYAPLTDEPMNSIERKFNNKIVIRTDWFESKELAHGFMIGKITYVHVYDTYYKKSINTKLKRFKERRIINVENGIKPYEGIYIERELPYKPIWVK